MKNILKIIVIALFFTNCKAQTEVNINTYNQGDNSNKYFKDINNNYPNFVGTWQNTTGNITFRLILWKETRRVLTNETNSFIDSLFGKYLIIQNVGMPNEIILHNSVKYFPQSRTTSTWSLYGLVGNPTSSSGSFMDTNANNGTGALNAFYYFDIINLGSPVLQAQWNLKSTTNLFAGESFTVPTSCILTKQ